jgi:hypothetical protein
LRKIAGSSPGVKNVRGNPFEPLSILCYRLELSKLPREFSKFSAGEDPYLVNSGSCGFTMLFVRYSFDAGNLIGIWFGMEQPQSGTRQFVLFFTEDLVYGQKKCLFHPGCIDYFSGGTGVRG